MSSFCGYEEATWLISKFKLVAFKATLVHTNQGDINDFNL